VIQEDYFRNSDLLTLEQWQKRPALEKVVQNTARLMDSFL
jgi:hypothetical protein